jgi:octaprenyl-diphosphate synthase
MLDYRDEALNILNEFEDSEARRALEQMVKYTTDRKY